MEPEKYFLGRQPILDTDQKLFGYELLFRSADSLYANVTNELQASAEVIVHALSHFGIQDVIGRHKGFMNVSLDILMGDMLELLPKEQVVIELLESIKATDDVVTRCHDLKEKGFTLALDDNLFDPSFTPLYEIVDIVKVDLLLDTPIPLGEMVANFRRWPLVLLAEKVETYEMFDQCKALGFELFQGYYFARPTVINGRKVDVTNMTLMRLMDQVLKDAETADIEETFKHNPELIFNLLRLVNSVFMGLREKISALRHAIAILGRDQLKRWVMLSLYATVDQRGENNPLMEMASLRGKLMELLAEMACTSVKNRDLEDCAFMTGVLSLLDALFGVPLAEIIEQSNLAEEVRVALLHRGGILGTLLTVVEHVEQSRFGNASTLLAEARLENIDIAAAHLEAIRWTSMLSAA